MKNLLIFGAYGALGRGVTETLLKKNYDKYYLFDFDAEKQFAGDQRVVNINSGDLSEEKNVKDVFGRITADIKDEVFLFSTVGGYFGGKEVAETSIDDLDRMLNINLKTNFLLAREYLLRFGISGKGALCFTTALSGFNPEKGKSAYGLSKSALNYLVKTLALECEEKGIAVNGIAPYIIDTSENRRWMKDADYEKWHKPEEIGELTNFIFNSRNFISGNIMSLKIRFRR
jgi:NAD(P)-dependent dehydrogenase (short-subunit alcohol dehydrogenase family)